MNKREKTKLFFKEKSMKLITYYFSMFLSVCLAGTFQDYINQKEVNQYKEIVKDFGDFLNDNGVTKIPQIFEYYNYALWGGYLSKDHNFQFNMDRDIFFSTYGLGCVLGDSVCLNNAGMLCDLYQTMGIDSDVVMCYIPAGKVTIDCIRKQNEITRKVAGDMTSEDSFVLINPIAFLFGNHAITVVFDNGEYYYYDPTNLAYLSKSDINDLDVINGSGSFKRRDLTTFLFEGGSALEGLFSTNEDNYNLDYINNLEDTNIDIEKLEEFYQQEKELIDSVYDSIKSKPQNVIRIISLVLTVILMVTASSILEALVNLKNIKKEDNLKDIITLFMLENGITKFEDVCSYLYALIDGGYITIDDAERIKIKASVLSSMPLFVTIDHKEYGEEFFYEYLKTQFRGVIKISGIDDNNLKQDFYVYRDESGYKFSSFGSNSVYNITDDFKLVNATNEYKIKKVFKSKYRKSEVAEQVHVNYKVLSGYEEIFKPAVEDIAKTYAYVPKK